MASNYYIRNASTIRTTKSCRIYELNDLYNSDNNPNKINLTIGVYRKHDKPYTLQCVAQAETELLKQNKSHEYSSLRGNSGFLKENMKLIYGTDIMKSYSLASIQTISGTGALRLYGEFHNFISAHKTIYLPNLTWSNHHKIFEECGFHIQYYPYIRIVGKNINYDHNRTTLYLRNLPKNSIVLFQTCGHNPTGCNPTKSEWFELSQISKTKDFYILFNKKLFVQSTQSLNFFPDISQ